MINRIKEKLKKVTSLGLYVSFSIISLIVFTIVSQILAMKYNVVLDTLTTCFFGFFGGEIVTCGLIKIFKLTRKDTTEENNSMGAG